MIKDIPDQIIETERALPEDHSVQQEVEELTSSIIEVTDESTLSEKVEALRGSLNEISQEVYSWRGKSYYIESIESLKQHVDGIQEEWNALSEGMHLQRERLESLLQTFPGIIETSTLKALTMRMQHLEEVVDDLINERQAKITSEQSRKQHHISIAALVISIFSSGAFILMRFIS